MPTTKQPTLTEQADEAREEQGDIFDAFVGSALKDMERQILRHAKNPEKINLSGIELRMRQALLLANVAGADLGFDQIEEQDPELRDEEIEKFGIAETLAKLTGQLVGQPKKGKKRKRTTFFGALNAFKERKPILGSLIKKNKKNIDRRSFFVTGLFRLGTVKKVQDSLKKSIKKGLSLRDFQKEVQKVTKLSKARLETVFRTNIQTANSEGRAESFKDSVSRGFIVAYIYNALVKDGRARPTHAAFNGFVADPFNRIWQIIWTPNGFNCRCVIDPVTKFKARRNGWLNKDGTLKKNINPSYLKGASRVRGIPPVFPKEFPDEGFRSGPTINISQREVRKEAEQKDKRKRRVS